VPYDDIDTNAEVMEFIGSGKRMALGGRLEEDKRLRRAASLVEDCWDANPEDRPKFRKISKTCRQIVDAMSEQDDGTDEESFWSSNSSSVSEGGDKQDAQTVLARLQEHNNGVKSLYEGDAAQQHPDQSHYAGRLFTDRVESSGSEPKGTYSVGNSKYVDKGGASAFKTTYARSKRS
jgi:hypothetical protein